MEPVVRRAESRADRLAVIDVAYAANQIQRPRALYRSRRLLSPLRDRAEWWLMEVDGRPVSSLLCYPLRFADGDQRLDGYGFGSVATLPEDQGNGYASRLCAAIAADAEARGRAVGALFSAIPPALYGRLGFRVAPCWGWSVQDLAAVAGGPALRPLDPRRDLGRLIDAWDRGHPGLRIHRDAEGWAESLALDADLPFFAVGDRGYLRIALDGESLEVVELLADDPDAALRGAAALALELGLGRLDTWHPPTPLLRRHGEDRGRAKTLLMLKGRPVEGAQLWGTDYF